MADQGHNQQSELPRRMFQIFCLAFLLLCIALPIVADESPAFPPIGNRYENIPEAAKAAVSVLKKLRVSTETGVEFADYDRAVSEGGMLVKAFVESDDAREMPELCLVLGNAVDCYLKVRELWLSKIESDGLGKKHEASALLATAQPLLWRAGGQNISAGVALTENPTNELPEIQRLLVDELPNLDAEKVLATAKTQKANAPRPPTDGPPDLKVLWGLLYVEGDHDGEGKFTSSTLSTAFWNIRIRTQGSVVLSEGGHISGFRFENDKDAKSAYEAVADGIGSDGEIAVGVGDTSWANRGPINGTMDVIFRRGPFVILVRARTKTVAELAARAKVVDTRIKKYLRVR